MIRIIVNWFKLNVRSTNNYSFDSKKHKKMNMQVDNLLFH